MKNKNTNLADVICRIQLTEVGKVASISIGTSNKARVVNFKTGYAWEELYGTPGSIEFQESQKESNAGPFFEQNLNIEYPGFDDHNLDDMLNYPNRLFLIRMVYQSGIVRLMGSKYNPAKCGLNYNTKSTKHTLQFTKIDTDRAFLLE